MTKVGFIGLGTMGFPMARHLAQAGHHVVVYNRTSARAEAWVQEHGGAFALTPREVAAQVDVVMTCVGNDDDLAQVVMGDDGILSADKKSLVIVDHTTTSPAIAKKLYAQTKDYGHHFLDAPITGGQSGAENAQLAIMVGGDEAIYNQVNPLLKVYGKTIVYMGESGNGQLTKCCNQILIAGAAQSVAESMAFGMKAGLDMEKAIAVMSGGSASSWMLINRGKTMTEDSFNFGFAVEWMRKDLGICLNEAKRSGAALPMAAVIDQFFALLQQQGHHRLDVSSLIKLLKN